MSGGTDADQSQNQVPGGPVNPPHPDPDAAGSPVKEPDDGTEEAKEDSGEETGPEQEVNP